jgi:hypothetical protein
MKKFILSLSDYKTNESAQTDNIKELEQRLASHDWYFDYSDDSRAYKQGRENLNKINVLIKDLISNGQNAVVVKLWDKYCPDQKQFKIPN